VNKVMEMGATMGDKGVSEKCTNAAVENLAACAMDGSMEVKVGCCSEECASGIKKVSVPPQHAVLLCLGGGDNRLHGCKGG
jgi:hypothetical protein